MAYRDISFFIGKAGKEVEWKRESRRRALKQCCAACPLLPGHGTVNK
jgi:hypothetical protein